MLAKSVTRAETGKYNMSLVRIELAVHSLVKLARSRLIDLPCASKIALRDISYQPNASPGRIDAQSRTHKHSWVQWSRIQTLDRIVAQPRSPVSVMHRHSMYCRETIVVRKVQNHDVQDQRSVECINFVLWTEVEGYAVLPGFEKSIKLADRI